MKNPSELFQRLCFEFGSRHETFHKTDDSQRNVKIESFISWTPSEIRLDASVMAGKSKGKGKGVGKGKSNFIRQRVSQIVTESGILSFSQKKVHSDTKFFIQNECASSLAHVGHG